ncbi:MAG: hypothetical protein RL677_727 [Actinomycetota bacterium]
MLNPSRSQIFRLLTSKNWLFLTGFIVIAIAVSTRLGIWQYERHEARVNFNQSVATALNSANQELDFSKNDYSSWQKITVEGSFKAESQKLVRRRYLEGQLGFWVVAKFSTTNGQVVLVNRGFTPARAAATESPDVSKPASGLISIEGYLQNLEPEVARPDDLPTGQVNAINRTQFELGAQDFPFYLNQLNGSGELQPVNPPELTFGSHLAYSLQWFVFAFMILLGWGILTRKELAELTKLD